MWRGRVEEDSNHLRGVPSHRVSGMLVRVEVNDIWTVPVDKIRGGVREPLYTEGLLQYRVNSSFCVSFSIAIPVEE